MVMPSGLSTASRAECRALAAAFSMYPSVVFDTKPIAFAVRDVVAGVDLDAIAQPGQGMALWLHAPDAQDIHDALAAAGTTIISAPVDGPFGRTFTFADPDGYQVTLHDRS